jgi:hypothetical protein
MDSPNALKVKLPSSISSNILDFLVSGITNREQRANLTLDFSNVKYIDLEGALSLICFGSIVSSRSLQGNHKTQIQIIYPTDNVLNYLMNLGFFGQLTKHIGFTERQEILHLENELKHQRRYKQRKNLNQSLLRPIILPIETIEKQTDSISGRDFENMVKNFVNHSLDSLDELLTLPHYKFNGKDYHDFRLSNVELYKNIFEHSKSWGIASIHARPNYGTRICFYDIGIGFMKSVSKFNSEEQSIEWALIDGNTSGANEDNDGYGLTIVQNFVLGRKGNIKIRSGDCEVQINSNGKKINKVQKFPGVQISCFIPI